MFEELRMAGEYGREMARQVGAYRLEDRLRNARRGSMGRTLALRRRASRPPGPPGGREMKSRVA